jgi:hypothetical protein
VCCTTAGNDIGDAVMHAVELLLGRNKVEASLRAIQDGATSLKLSCERACPVGRGGWRGLGRFGLPFRRARCEERVRDSAPDAKKESETAREPLRGRAPRAALVLPAASGPARSCASFPCARASAWNRVALTWARGRGCAAPPQATISAPAARQLWRPGSRRTRRSRRSTSDVRERARVAAGD